MSATAAALASAYNSPIHEVTLTLTDESGRIILHPYFASRLRSEIASYVLAEAIAGRTKQALRVAYCFTRGVVYAKCPTGHYAKAHPNLCHDPGCFLCGTAKSRLMVWMRTRNEDKLIHDTTQFGIELFAPGLTRVKLRKAANKFIKSLGPASSVSVLKHEVIEKDGVTAIRLAIHGLANPNYSRLASQWSNGYLTLQRSLLPKALLQWTFKGAEDLLLQSGAIRSRVLAECRGRWSRTTGTFYSPLGAIQLAEIREKRKKDPAHCQCPTCKATLIEIPLPERHNETIDEVNARYPIVDWSAQRPIATAANSHSVKPLPPMYEPRPRFQPRYGPN